MKTVKCPKCGKPAEKRGLWKSKSGNHRLYAHNQKKVNGFMVITSHCMVKES